MNAVTMVIKPINGKRNALTTPISTPTFIITIENSPRGAASANATRNDFPLGCLNAIFPRRLLPNFIATVTAINAIARKM
jgi:hypothetical protein